MGDVVPNAAPGGIEVPGAAAEAVDEPLVAAWAAALAEPEEPDGPEGLGEPQLGALPAAQGELAGRGGPQAAGPDAPPAVAVPEEPDVLRAAEVCSGAEERDAPRAAGAGPAAGERDAPQAGSDGRLERPAGSAAPALQLAPDGLAALPGQQPVSPPAAAHGTARRAAAAAPVSALSG